MDYPADIVEAAKAARRAEPQSDYAALAFAIRQERERCAKIAENSDFYLNFDEAKWQQQTIAAAIRREPS